ALDETIAALRSLRVRGGQMARALELPSRPVPRRGNIFWRTVAVGGRLLALVVLVVAAVAFVFPLVWMFSTSLKAESEVFAVPPIWIPAKILWSNYPDSLTYFPFVQYL